MTPRLPSPPGDHRRSGGQGAPDRAVGGRRGFSSPLGARLAWSPGAPRLMGAVRAPPATPPRGAPGAGLKGVRWTAGHTQSSMNLDRVLLAVRGKQNEITNYWVIE